MNVAYPSEQDAATIDLLTNFDVDEWQPNLFVRGTLRHQPRRDYAGQLARFIDRYFTEILDAGDQYDVASQLARHAEG